MHGERFRAVFHTVSAHQKSMGIDAVGRAGDEGAEILARDDPQGIGLMRLNDENLVDLIGENLIQNAENKGIALREFIEVGKELGTGQAAVPGKHAVGAFTADRQAGPIQMANSDLQHGFIGAVVDRQGDIETVDFDIAHNAGAADIQKRLIRFIFRIGE